MEKRLVIALVIVLVGIAVISSLSYVGVQLSPGSFDGVISKNALSLDSGDCFKLLNEFDGTNVAGIQTACSDLNVDEAVGYAKDNGVSQLGSCSIYPRADVDGDGFVAFSDILPILSNWQCTDCSNEDVNEDGIVNFGDILIVLSEYTGLEEEFYVCQCSDLEDNDGDDLIDLDDPGCESAEDDDEFNEVTDYEDFLLHSELLPFEPIERSYFGGKSGRSVSLDGYSAVIGAPWDDSLSERGGSAYVFKFDGLNWDETQKLLPSASATDHVFGGTVKAYDSMMIIGAPGRFQNGYDGQVFVFRDDDDSYSEVQRILPIIDGIEIRFGLDIDVEDGRMLIGAPKSPTGEISPYKYDGRQWILDNPSSFKGYDSLEDDLFGHSVSISGNRAAIGAPGNGLGGAVYLFSYAEGEWIETTKIIALDIESEDFFGSDVALSGEWLLVGNPHDRDLGETYGSVYVFRYEGGQWIEKQKIRGSSVSEGDSFGERVEVSGDVMVVSNRLHSSDGFSHDGASYIFSLNRETFLWEEKQIITLPDRMNDLQFGYQVGLDRENIIYGVGIHPEQGVNAGKAYLFSTGVCGDGNVNQPGEVCDDGEMNGEFGYCNLECTGIENSYVRTSGELGPICSIVSQNYIFTNVPRALENVVLTFNTYSDIGASNEFVSVKTNGQSQGDIFTTGYIDCSEPPGQDTIIIDKVYFNDNYAGEDLNIEMDANGGVSCGGACGQDSWISVEISYTPE